MGPSDGRDLNAYEPIRTKKASRNAELAMKALIESTNIMGSDKAVTEGMVNAMLRSHPTLLQSFFRGLVSSCKSIQEDCPHAMDDGRLTGSKELVKRIAEFDEAIPFI
jgi:hypothetical protein